MGGPVWGTATEELNATILEWGANDGPGETVGKLDVVLAVLAGSVEIDVDGGARYVTVHRRRAGLQVATLPRR